MTALHGAAEGGRVEVVKVILEKAGEKKEELCNKIDGDGKNPCQLAVDAQQKAVVKALKDLGDPNAASVACVIS